MMQTVIFTATRSLTAAVLVPQSTVAAGIEIHAMADLKNHHEEVRVFGLDGNEGEPDRPKTVPYRQNLVEKANVNKIRERTIQDVTETALRLGAAAAIALLLIGTGLCSAQEDVESNVAREAKVRSAPAVPSPTDSMDPSRKASYENVRRLRRPQRQEPPGWVKEYYKARIQVLLERARTNYEESGIWFYCKYANTDCGPTVWWDEVATARTWGELLKFLGDYERLPHYSAENHRKAIEFWQSWQNKEDGRLYNPFLEDPCHPEAWRNAEGYNLDQYKDSGGRRVNQKYVPGILGALGAKPLRETLATQVVITDDRIPVEQLEEMILHGDTGNYGCRMLHIMAEKIDAGQTDLIADYERLMAVLLQQFHPSTGMLDVSPETDFNRYGPSADNVKGFARIVGYDGLENYPYRHALANALADQVGRTRITPAGAVRNYAYLMTLCLQQSDACEEDLFREIAEIVEILRNSTADQEGYKWMALSTASTWLNWDIAPLKAFHDPSAAACDNGATRPNRSVVGPFGRWVNIIPKAAEEIYGHSEFSWETCSLRARNRRHEAKRLVEVVPTLKDAKASWRWTDAYPGEGWARRGLDDKAWNQGRPVAVEDAKALWMRYDFDLDASAVTDPYLKARWNGSFEMYLNGVLVKRVAGKFPEYCGLYIPSGAAKTLDKGRNVIAIKAVNPGTEPVIDVGLLEWK